MRLDFTKQDNDAIFKAWRTELGTDRAATQRIMDSEATPVIWPGERNFIWLDKRQPLG